MGGTLYRTEKYSDKRFHREDIHPRSRSSQQATSYIVDEHTTYQNIVGFGGAFTEASAYNLLRVDDRVRKQAIRDYFDPEYGLGYTLGRISIHSCDFSLNSYTYIDEGDESLESFDISRDKKAVIPLIKEAEKWAGPIDLIASPWSPPAFMKDNQLMIKGGSLLPEYYPTWAAYIAKFVDEYKKQGLSVWGVTVQNEPAAQQRWDSCEYTAEQERDFVKNHLGPLLESRHKDMRILIWDHNRDLMVERAKTILDDPEASRYVWGTAFHWYVSDAFENVGKVHTLYPDKGLLFTEGCREDGVHWNDWTTGERYAYNMFGDFNNFCQGYIDWNLFLDETGGPNHVNNLCDAPIIVRVNNEELTHQSSYYYIGHFSKFVRPGAQRVHLHSNGSTDDTNKMIAFKNKDDSVVFIAMNDDETTVTMNVNIRGDEYHLEIEPRSIVTLMAE